MIASSTASVLAPPSLCRAMGHRLNFIDITRTCHSRSSQTGNAMPPYDVTPIQPPHPTRCLPLWHAINFYERTTLFINSQTALPKLINFYVQLLSPTFAAYTRDCPNPITRHNQPELTRASLLRVRQWHAPCGE